MIYHLDPNLPLRNAVQHLFCIAQIQRTKHALDPSGYTAPNPAT